jgi:hypothetical protein
MHFTLDAAIRSGASSNTNHGDYRDFDYFGGSRDAICLSSVGRVDQCDPRNVAGYMSLGSGYQFVSNQSKSNCCRAAGLGVGDLRALGSAPPIEQSNLRTHVLATILAEHNIASPTEIADQR